MTRADGLGKTLKLSKPIFLTNLLLFSAFFTFYYVFTYHAIPQMVNSEYALVLQACCTLGIAVAILAFSFLKNTFTKRSIILFTSLNVLTLLIALMTPSLYFRAICIILVGAFFGVSQLSAYMYFANTTKSEVRGRIGGIIGFITLPLYFLASNFLASALNLLGNIFLCIILSSVALLASLLIKNNSSVPSDVKEPVYFPEKRTIIYYAVPWIIFSLINATLAVNITNGTLQWISSSFYTLLIIAQTIAGLVGAIGGGFLADHYGRKIVLILAISLYGVSMAFRGFVYNEGTFLFASIGEGLSSGIFLTMFSFVVWGDLADRKNYAKAFAIGLITFYLSVSLGRLNVFSGIPLIASALISCILIFLSNIPLAIAPELLPPELHEKTKLKNYMKTVKKIADNQE